MSSAKWIVRLLLILLLIVIAANSQEELRQVVLMVDHTMADGTVVVVPKAVVVMGLKPLQHSAPVPDGSFMVCRPYSDQVTLRDGSKLTEIAFRCGNDRYLFLHLQLQPTGK